MSVARLGKSVAPALSRLMMNPGLDRVVRAVELAASVTQGKGASAAWDLSAEVRAALRFVTAAEPIIVDVGAKTGEWSKQVAALTNYSRIVQIEPQPSALTELRRLGLPRVDLVEVAVSDQAGMATFYTTATGVPWGASSLFERRDTYFADVRQQAIEVPVRTLDDVLQGLSIRRVDLMKMDIEGAELLALRGASRALEAGAISALTFEFGSANINSRSYFRDFWLLLTPLGYQIHRMLPDGRAKLVSVYTEDLEYFRGVTNYVAVLPG